MANIGRISTAKGEVFTNAHVRSIARASEGIYVLSGCDVHQAGTPGLSVVVDAGYVAYGFASTRKTVAGGTLSIATPDATYPRIDLVYVDSTGAIAISAGTPAAISPSGKTDFKQMASPSPIVSIPNGVILALVYVTANETTILDADINDIAMYGSYVVDAPTSTTTSTYVPQWSSTQRTLTTGLPVGTSANNLLLLDGSGRMAVANIANGVLGQTIVQSAGNPVWATRNFDVAYCFGDGNTVVNDGRCEYRIPVTSVITAVRIQDTANISGSITCNLYMHTYGTDKGSLVDSFVLNGTNYYEVLSIACTADTWIMITVSGAASVKQITCSLAFEARQ